MVYTSVQRSQSNVIQVLAISTYHGLSHWSYVAGYKEILKIIGYGIVYLVANFLMTALYILVILGDDSVSELTESLKPQFLAVMGATVLIGVLLSVVLRESGLAGA
jgi:hypothetical protein